MGFEGLRSFDDLPTDQREALIGLTQLPGIGASLAVRLWQHFADAQAIFDASEAILSTIEGFGPTLCKRIREGFDRKQAQNLLRRTEELGFQVLLYGHPDYPQGLTRLPTPPLLLYVSGSLQAARSPSRMIAIVGTRKPDRRGVRLTSDITNNLSSQGWSIVSGGALGIDTTAHFATLENQGHTVAVLATGLDQAYPSQNRDLFQRIVRQDGALVSEFPPGTRPERGYFPRRNRLISGLCAGVVVVQCGANSGALNTATHAQRIDIPVMTFPGMPQDPLSAGPHQLIRAGASLVESAEEIAHIAMHSATSPPPQLSLWSPPSRASAHAPSLPLPSPPQTQLTDGENDLDPSSRDIIRLLHQDTPQHIDEIATNAAMPVAQVSARLLLMELEGHVMSHPGQRYTRLCVRKFGENS